MLQNGPEKKRMIPNRRLLLPYVAPYFAYIAIASTVGTLLPTEIDYILRIVVSVGFLAWAWRWYLPFTGSKSPLESCFAGVVAGLLGLFLWIILLSPFAEVSEAQESWKLSAFLLRLLSASLLVPVIEELVMRRYIFCLAHQWCRLREGGDKQPLQAALDESSIDDIPAGEWSWAAVIISTLAFTSAHQFYEWPASIAYGLLMSFLYIYRKDLLSCIVAHGVTNMVLALYVYATGSWWLW
jgi:uncharacterized protein